MKILGLVCSPRHGGNTEILMNEALRAARDRGAGTELIFTDDLDIAPCEACDTCIKKGVCKTNDDMHKIYDEMDRADGIIFGTPVYFLNVSAQAKTIIDRTYSLLFTGKLRGKVAGAIVAVRRVGGGQVLSLMYSFFSVHRMINAGGGIGYGREKGEVNQGTGGSPVLTALEEAGAVGKNVVRMIQKTTGS